VSRFYRLFRFACRSGKSRLQPFSQSVGVSDGNSMIAGRVGAPARPGLPGVGDASRPEVPDSPRVFPTASARKRAAAFGSQLRKAPTN